MKTVLAKEWNNVVPTSQQGGAGALADASSPGKMARFRPPHQSVPAQTQLHQARGKASRGTRCQELAASAAGHLPSVAEIRFWHENATRYQVRRERCEFVAMFVVLLLPTRSWFLMDIFGSAHRSVRKASNGCCQWWDRDGPPRCYCVLQRICEPVTYCHF